MIFAAGLGSRLYPLTESKPKALVEICGKTLLEITINQLKSFGIQEFVINVHHFADQIINYLRTNNYFNSKIIVSDESSLLLDTGGGLKKAEDFLKDDSPILIHNVDILSDMDFETFINQHNSKGKEIIASIVVNSRKSGRVFLENDNHFLCGWKNLNTGEEKIPNPQNNLHPVSFCGIHLVNSTIFNLISLEGVFSMVDVYLHLCKNEKIICYKDNSKWMDVGTIDKLEQAQSLFDKRFK